MSRVASAAALAIAVVALAVALMAWQRADDEGRPPGVLSTRSILTLRSEMANRKLTREDVIEVIGWPASIYRDNPRAECWAYEAPGGGSGREQPYELQMCFGPKRYLAWLAYSGPTRLRPPA